ncbi:MAG: DNA cytosine methyltransferase [Balneolaceae bacterium]
MIDRDNRPIILFIDLFCGAGGVTTGAVQARLGKYIPVKVVACVNHDPLAIESHEYNHPGTIHFSEDIRKLDAGRLTRIIDYYRQKYPNAIVALWASMECTNYSKAKGGMPRDADSRSLPDEMDRYINAIDPDYFLWENVQEFMCWGPLDENGKPLSRKNGKDWLAWQKRIKSLGYRHEWKMLNAADYGAHTKRKRLFGIFAKDGFPIAWPKPTHSDNRDGNNMFGELKPWNAVKECLNFEIEGKSIFTRKKELVEKTLKRVIAGMRKYVANGDGFIYKYYSNGDNTESLDQPSGTITTKDRMALVQSAFLDKGFSGVHNHQSINDPSGALPTKDHYSVVKATWLDKQFSSPLNHQSISVPAGSIMPNDKHCMVQAFLDLQFSQGTRHQSINQPAGALLTVPKMNLVKVKSAFLMNPQFSSKGGSIEDPCFTLIASMDKRPPYLVQSNLGEKTPKIKSTDSKTMREIKKFCFVYGITDITTRMLNVTELKKIQGFPDDYYLAGNKTDQKKFIGNSVVPKIVKAMMETLSNEIKTALSTNTIALSKVS